MADARRPKNSSNANLRPFADRFGPDGTFLGWVFVRAIAADEGFGVFAAPVGQLALVVGLGALVGIVAALRPARRAARLDVLTAIATE